MQLGQAAIQNKNLAEAVVWFAKAATENPKDPQVKACLGQSLCWQAKRDEGILHLRQSGELLLKKARKNRDINLALDLIDQLHFWQDYVGAVALCNQAVKINPDSVRAYHSLALSHSQLNQKKLALSAGRKALRLAPDSAALVIFMASLEVAEGFMNEAKSRLEKVLQKSSLTVEERFRAHKELARLLDKLGEYGQVFKHLHLSGELSPHIPEVARQSIQLVPQMLISHQTGFDRELLGRWAGVDFPDNLPAPVFLLGFMRTGTTLTQEVLGAHPRVFVADETDFVVSAVQELDRLSNYQGSLSEQLRRLDWEDVQHLRQFYWNRAKSHFGDKIGTRMLLDKTTMNSINLGFINCIFPDAKVVFLLRDPRDVCLSCFMQTMVPTPSTVHLLTWQNTARFYAQIMDWWMVIKPQLTLAFIEFRYEDAVFEFEPAFRAVFNLLDLEWDPAVSEFHKNVKGKHIASPSINQVAQPIYASSVGRWRHYSAEYSAISDMLQPFIYAFGYDV